jgi:hypothetical protein
MAAEAVFRMYPAHDPTAVVAAVGDLMRSRGWPELRSPKAYIRKCRDTLGPLVAKYEGYKREEAERRAARASFEARPDYCRKHKELGFIDATGNLSCLRCDYEASPAYRERQEAQARLQAERDALDREFFGALAPAMPVIGGDAPAPFEPLIEEGSNAGTGPADAAAAAQ